MLNRLFPLLIIIGLIFVLFNIVACGDDDDDDDDTVENPFEDDDDSEAEYIVDPVINEAPPWPQWVLRHWVWEDESTQDSALSLVADYLENDIPVGAIIIDSPWETGYNTFEFDTDLYPSAQDMIDEFHDSDVRVFMWITPNVNDDSPNFQEGLDNGYYVNDGALTNWWKGDGAFIDYNNPDALQWWHGLMDKVLDMGIDGWKTDGSAFMLWFSGFVDTFTGPINPHQYQALYYSDFFNYTREKLGNDRVITSRPVDSYGIPFWGPTFSPRDVCFAGWVGDQDPTWGGLTAALINLKFSSEAGYVNFGSDIGGYRGDEIRQKELFIRWAQLGSMCPIMENGGSGEHRPWMYDEETLNIYRSFTKLHHQLIPYLYSQGATSYARGVSLMRFNEKGFHYLLGDNLFVASIYADSNDKTIKFPDGTWIDFFGGAEYEGGTTEDFTFSLDQYPIFVKKGAIIPLDLGDASLYDLSEEELPPLTVSFYPEPGQSSTFDVYEEFGSGAKISASYSNTISIRLSATSRKYVFRVFSDEAPISVEYGDGAALDEVLEFDSLASMDGSFTFVEEDGAIWIKPGDPSKGIVIRVRFN